jgi:1,4-alpha-glucan branching enzyme
MIFMRVDGFLTPKAEKVDVHLVHPGDRVIAMQPVDGGYFTAAVEEIASGALYLYCLEGQTERPDPASRFQSHAARGLSEVADSSHILAVLHVDDEVSQIAPPVPARSGKRNLDSAEVVWGGRRSQG